MNSYLIVEVLVVGCVEQDNFTVLITDSGALPRQKRRYTSTNMANKAVNAIYHRLVEVIDTLTMLLQLQSLTDMTVLKVLL